METCPVCLDEKKLETLACKHGCCGECIAKWRAVGDGSCPTCRAGKPAPPELTAAFAELDAALGERASGERAAMRLAVERIVFMQEAARRDGNPTERLAAMQYAAEVVRAAAHEANMAEAARMWRILETTREWVARLDGAVERTAAEAEVIRLTRLLETFFVE